MITFREFLDQLNEALTLRQKSAELKTKRKNILVKDISNFQEPEHKVHTTATKNGNKEYFKDKIRAKNKHDAIFKTQIKYHKMGYKVHDVTHKGIVKEKKKNEDI